MSRAKKIPKGKLFLALRYSEILLRIFNLGIFSGCPTFKHKKQHGVNSGVPNAGAEVSTNSLLRVRLEKAVGLGRRERGGHLKKYLKKSKARERPVL